MSNIYIYSGPTQSGKTTKLMQWAAPQKNIDGVFQPVIENKRFLYNISSRSLKELEVEDGDDLISIGNYKFNNKSFLWAQEKLLEACKTKIDKLIIDEIGPLELDGKGLEPAISKILSDRSNFDFQIILVVREKLLNDFLKHYCLGESFKKFEVA